MKLTGLAGNQMMHLAHFCMDNRWGHESQAEHAYGNQKLLSFTFEITYKLPFACQREIIAEIPDAKFNANPHYKPEQARLGL